MEKSLPVKLYSHLDGSSEGLRFPGCTFPFAGKLSFSLCLFLSPFFIPPRNQFFFNALDVLAGSANERVTANDCYLV